MMSINELDVFWVLLCACLVWIMQAGFLCLETGLTRSKNNINVALKNICDNATSIFLFWLLGFSIAFGVPFSAPFELDRNFYLFESADNKVNAFFVFQAVFCSTCCTIVSGAAAERLRFIMYPILVAIIAGLIYPVVANACWGGVLIQNALGILVGHGFYDFAGSSVVHSTGGWIALALIIVVGPRLGRFNAAGKAQTIQGSNLTLSSLGVLILWFGWLGFNGGSAYNFESDIGIILSNTLISGSTSLVATLAIVGRNGRNPSAEDLINGALGGLVGITASANCVSSLSAFLIGVIAAIFVLIASRLLLRYQLDDVVGAVPVHLAAGIWGTLAVGIFADPASIGSGLTTAEQIGVQLIGILVIGIWAFGVSFILFKLIDHYYKLRVSKNDETVGLNISEHGASTELYELLAFMKYQSETGSLASQAPTDLFTESGVIGMAYNHVMDTVRLNEEKLKVLNEELQSYDKVVAHDLKNPLAVIRSYAALIEEDNEAGFGKNKYISRIRSSAEDALKIISELLKVAESGGEHLRTENINVIDSFKQAQLQFDDELEEKGVKFILEIKQESLKFNAFALQQVLVNLLSNALKYSKTDIAPVITIRCYRSGNVDILEVEDNGIGMTMEQQGRVFDKHSRLHTDTVKDKGHGLGLYNARKLVASCGGRLEVISAPGTGSCFSIHIPNPMAMEPAESFAL